jgi:hypothetical protein
LPPDVVREAGFREVVSEPLSYAHSYTRDQLISFMFTLSNIRVALRKGGETPESINQWLGSTLEPFFDGGIQTFDHVGSFSLMETTD